MVYFAVFEHNTRGTCAMQCSSIDALRIAANQPHMRVFATLTEWPAGPNDVVECGDGASLTRHGKAGRVVALRSIGMDQNSKLAAVPEWSASPA